MWERSTSWPVPSKTSWSEAGVDGLADLAVGREGLALDELEAADLAHLHVEEGFGHGLLVGGQDLSGLAAAHLGQHGAEEAARARGDLLGAFDAVVGHHAAAAQHAGQHVRGVAVARHEAHPPLGEVDGARAALGLEDQGAVLLVEGQHLKQLAEVEGLQRSLDAHKQAPRAIAAGPGQS